MNKEIEKIYKDARMDPTLFSKLDPEELLRELAKDKNNYIEEKTTADILNEMKQLMKKYYIYKIQADAFYVN